MFSWLPIRQRDGPERGLIDTAPWRYRARVCLGCLSHFGAGAGLSGGAGLGDVYIPRLRSFSLLRLMLAHRRLSYCGVSTWV